MLLKNCTANSWNCTITRAFTFVYTQGGLPYKPMALIERVPDNYFVWLYFFQIWSRFWRLLIRSDASGILVAGQIYITRIQRGNWLMGGVKLSALNLKKKIKSVLNLLKTQFIHLADYFSLLLYINWNCDCI